MTAAEQCGCGLDLRTSRRTSLGVYVRCPHCDLGECVLPGCGRCVWALTDAADR